MFSGCRDTRGAQVVFVFCGDAALKLDTFTALELARLLLYYQALPR